MISLRSLLSQPRSFLWRAVFCRILSSNRKELVKTKEEESSEDREWSVWKRMVPTKEPLRDFKQHMNSRKLSDMSSDDMLLMIQRRYDLSWSGFKRMLLRFQDARQVYLQRFIPHRHGILDSKDTWTTDYPSLPNKFDKNYTVVAVDATDCNLYYEGLDNLTMLEHCEELYLNKNAKLDDWACDKIARQFRNSKNLRILDISDNPLITYRGIETLHRIRSLKKLVFRGTQAAEFEFIQLLILLFNEVNPDCELIT